MSHFIKWLGNSTIKSQKSQTIAGTMTITTYTLDDDRVFVVADNALVSYDGGFYESFNKDGDIFKVIRCLEQINALN